MKAQTVGGQGAVPMILQGRQAPGHLPPVGAHSGYSDANIRRSPGRLLSFPLDDERPPIRFDFVPVLV